MEEPAYNYVARRGLTLATMKHYRVLTEMQGDVEKAVLFPYIWGKVGKVRQIEEKKFHWRGEYGDGPLFGEEIFPRGCSDTITITEGEYDAMSVWQSVGRPGVSVRSSGQAKSDCERRWEYLNSFKKIIIAFDSDAPGQKATQLVAGLFDFDKVYVINFGALKDANQYLQDGRNEDLRRLWFNAKHYLPEGVISSFSDFDEAIDDDQLLQPICSLPFSGLQEMLYGLFPGVTLVTAQEGIGKTEIVRAIEHHVLRTTDHNIGVIHLEEDKARTLRGFSGLELGCPVHLPDCQVPKEKIKAALRDLIKREDRLHVYSHFGTDNPEVILDLVRYLVAVCKCRVIALDHITMLVTSKEDDDERRFLDYISTKLAKMANDLGFALILVSHVNDDGKTRGSRNISKVAKVRIDLRRNIEAEDPIERNTTQLMVSKNRPAAITGPAKSLIFSAETFSLSEAVDPHEEPRVDVKKVLDNLEIPV